MVPKEGAKKEETKSKGLTHALNTFGLLKKKSLWHRLLLSLALFGIIISLLLFAVVPERVHLEEGRPSPKTIYAPREATDYYTTEQLREEAAQAVPETYDYEPAVNAEIEEDVNSFFEEIFEIRRMEEEEEDKLEMLQGFFQDQLEEEVEVEEIRSFLEMPRDELEEFHREALVIINGTMEQGVKEEGLDNVKNHIYMEIILLPYDENLTEKVAEIAQGLIRPNMIYNEEATQRSREEAREAVEPVRILKGSLIVSEGEVVTEKHMAQLEAVGLQRTLTNYSVIAGLVFLLLAVFIIGGIYLYLYEKEVYYSPSLLLLLGIVLIITLVFTLAANYFSGYLIPVAMGIILITVLFNARLAIMCNMLLAILIGVMTGGEFSYIIVALLGGLTAVYSVAQVSNRADLTRAGLYVALVNTLAIISVFLYWTGFGLEYEIVREFSLSILAGVSNGLFSAVMAIGLLPYLESGFGLTTAVSLLELANPNQPLLRKLMMKAPGTYHHSIVVANLAEAAAEVVEADPLLARVGAYYHDIGKIKRPYFFIENQFTNDNPHNKISPSLSTLIITAHVKDGVEMARQGKLPDVIKDIIRQHHGTSLVAYFYHMATENEKNEEVVEESFRYEGPKPQTKEAAIIMLADVVEAAVRAMSKPTAGRVEGLTRKIIKDKLNDGQLDESDLTLKDLDKIAEAMSKVLSGIFHSRIEYPEKELKAEIERGKKKDDINNKQSSE